MTASRSIVPLFGVGVLIAAALLVAGCDEHAVESDGAREVVFDVGPLFRTAAGDSCATVVDSLLLTVTEADGTERTEGRLLTPADAEVRIPVEVDAGRVTFEAEVRSDNGTPLYTGSASADVEDDGFSVEVPLAAVDAVLKACPDVVPLVLTDDAYRGELRLFNRGSRATSWEATVEPPLCDGEPCFRLTPSAGTVAAGDSVRVFGTALASTRTDAFDVRISSPVGTLDVRFVAEVLAPVARPDTAAVLEGGTVGIDVLANDTDPEGEPLTLVSVGPATFGTTEQDDDLAFYTAEDAPLWGETSEDGFTYVADAGGRRAEGGVVVHVVPCMTFEETVAAEAADVPFYTENDVPTVTRPFHFDPNASGFGLAIVRLLPQSNDDLGVYLTDAALEFDWAQQPVRYVRFDFLDEAATINVAINGGERVITPTLTPALPLPPGITPRIEDGKFGPATRLVLEGDAATPIERLLLGGGEEDGGENTLLLDDVCFGLASPDGN